MRRRTKVVVGALAVLAALLASLCAFVGIRSRMDVLAYYTMVRTDFHPVWKDLALRRFGHGGDIGALLKKHTPKSREDFPPYALLDFEEPFNSMTVVAKDGKLIMARAGSCTWHHVFFATPDATEEFSKAHEKHVAQILCEGCLFRIRRVALANQSIFLARKVGDDIPADRTIAVGDEFYSADSPGPTIVVEVTKTIRGNIGEGTRLGIPMTVECRAEHLAEEETVFLYVSDSRVIYPHTQGGGLCKTASKPDLDRYLAMSSKELEELDTRCLARWHAHCYARHARNGGDRSDPL